MDWFSSPLKYVEFLKLQNYKNGYSFHKCHNVFELYIYVNRKCFGDKTPQRNIHAYKQFIYS